MIRKIFSALVVVMVLGVTLAPGHTYAFDPFGTVCQIGGGDSAVCQEKVKNGSDPLIGTNGLLRGVSNIIAIIAGLAAVIVIVISGFKYITSAGDAAKTKSAKDTIVYALIGLVVIVLADSIITFVLNRI